MHQNKGTWSKNPEEIERTVGNSLGEAGHRGNTSSSHQPVGWTLREGKAWGAEESFGVKDGLFRGQGREEKPLSFSCGRRKPAFQKGLAPKLIQEARGKASKPYNHNVGREGEQKA